MAKFPERLKQLREEAHMTQTDLAVKLGLSNGAIVNYEAGAREPRIEQLESIADFFNVDIGYLLGESNQRPEITLEESWLLACYRNADEDAKTIVRAALRRFDAETGWKP